MRILVNIPKGVIRDSFFDKEIEQRLEAIGEVTYNHNCEQSMPDLDGIEILLTAWGHPKIRPANISDSLKLIVHTGGTVAPIVDTDIFEKGVQVISGNRYYAESVAEGTLAYMLFALRDMGYYSSQLKQGIWHSNAKTQGLLDQTVGIVSLGAISKNIIAMGKVFRMKFKVYSTHRDDKLAEELGFTYASLEEIFSSCKIVSIHTAASQQTKNMINAELLKLLQPGSVLLNTARAMVIDEEALVEELKTGRFRAVLDVYTKEPLEKDSPFMQLDNVMLFPHQAGPTYDRRAHITNYLIDDIERFVKGEAMINQITRETAMRMTQTK